MCPCSVRVDTCRSGWCPGYLGPDPRRSPRTRRGQLHSPPAPWPTGATRCASSLSSPPPVLRLPASAQRATLGPRCTPVAGKPVIEPREDEPIDLAAPRNSSKSALRLEQQRRAFRLLELDAELAFEVGIKDSGAIEIEAFDSDTVAHVCETMAQKVV